MDCTNCKEHSGIIQRQKDQQSEIAEIKADNSKQWEMIDQIRNRPPVWCTVVIAILGTLIGSISTYAALAIKFSAVAQAAH